MSNHKATISAVHTYQSQIIEITGPNFRLEQMNLKRNDFEYEGVLLQNVQLSQNVSTYT